MKKQQDTVVKDIDETRERFVTGVSHALPRVFREVRGERPVGTPHAHEGNTQARGALLVLRLEGCDGARLEGERRFLTYPERLFARPHSFAEPRLVGEQYLEPPKRDVEVEASGVALQPFDPAQIDGR
jgi:hypothetical protein